MNQCEFVLGVRGVVKTLPLRLIICSLNRRNCLINDALFVFIVVFPFKVAISIENELKRLDFKFFSAQAYSAASIQSPNTTLLTLITRFREFSFSSNRLIAFNSIQSVLFTVSKGLFE